MPLMTAMDLQDLETPFCGSKWLKARLGAWGHGQARRECGKWCGPRDPGRDIPASPRQPAVAGVRVYLHLLSNASGIRPNPEWAGDVTRP